ncbi:hypothetical protein FXN61_45930 [Lentzea sp. PSKA42]|uniref:Uncharacterized protein n=1 Tax=Lentzea indica TaxID=2604800 RepID=A0ABX1FX94_9PSEU|nr:hypothetical protein [Lentzea indica]NKE63670.1 hypothetical protein [Lentzea indica]
MDKNAAKVTASALLVATVGVVVQIVAGVDFPPVPPVFFIQLVPAAFVYFGRWRWTPVMVILAGLFLVAGLFASGDAGRLTDTGLPGGVGGSIGLWIQMVAVVVATATAVVALVRR